MKPDMKGKKWNEIKKSFFDPLQNETTGNNPDKLHSWKILLIDGAGEPFIIQFMIEADVSLVLYLFTAKTAKMVYFYTKCT